MAASEQAAAAVQEAVAGAEAQADKAEPPAEASAAAQEAATPAAAAAGIEGEHKSASAPALPGSPVKVRRGQQCGVAWHRLVSSHAWTARMQSPTRVCQAVRGQGVVERQITKAPRAHSGHDAEC